MHDIWNPWHGCIKCSDGCANCYMYFLDKLREQDGSSIYKTKSGFKYPHYHPITCRECASRLICNGCSDCGKCEKTA